MGYFFRLKCGTPTVGSASSPSPSTPAASPTSPSPPAASSSSALLWTAPSGRTTCTGGLLAPGYRLGDANEKKDSSTAGFGFCRYRNFRTFTSPRPAQFSSLAVDVSGELVSAGAQDSFEIFLWSMQTGRLLEVGKSLCSFSCSVFRLVEGEIPCLWMTRSSEDTRVRLAPCVLVLFSPSWPALPGTEPSACGTCWTAGRSKKHSPSHQTVRSRKMEKPWCPGVPYVFQKWKTYWNYSQQI